MDNLRNFDLIITDNKKELLSFLNDSKKLLNIKIISYQEFIDSYFGYINSEALYYLVKKYNYSYEVANMYLKNFLYIDSLYKELQDNNLIKFVPLFKKSFKRIVLDNIKLDPYVINKLSKYEIVELNKSDKNYNPKLFEYKTIEDEINGVCLSILLDVNSVNIDKIHLVNVGDDYKKHIKRIFSFYNIPVNLNDKISLYGLPVIKDFIKKLDDSLDSALEVLEKSEYKKYVIDIINKYAFAPFDDTVKYLIKEELKTKKISSKKISNAVDIVDIDKINNSDIYYILNCNQGVFPKTYKDEDYLTDIEKTNIGLFTSLDKNKQEKIKTINIILSCPNIRLSYITSSKGEEMYRSSILKDLKLENNINDSFNKSNIYNKLRLSYMLDDYIKFNIHNKNLDKLYYNYKDINYLDYDNSYKTIDESLFNKYIDNKLNLSYSSINNFYKCKFRFYLNDILKLNEYEETFHTIIGNLFHHILECAFKPNFDFEKEFNSFIADKELNYKEKFFINKLKEDLHFIIDVINEQDSDSNLDKSYYEKKFTVNKDSSIKVTFKGFIDKIKYNEFNGKTVVAIIDYKTGNPDINLDKVYYGIDMQLPIYIYLVKNSELINVEIAGFYLQHLLPPIDNYQEGKDYYTERKNKYKLTGYSNSNRDILELFDKNYIKSNMIKSMSVTLKDEFSSNAKVLSDGEMDKLVNHVDDKINEAIKDIESRDFSINPKQIGEFSGCEHCRFKDICYKKEEDIVRLKEVDYKEFLGGEDNA
ncbi:MAG: PD-(D/E)XK nuclease family protein [Bacilli bacterium]|nr:PD-(D/E)XK nuclease family protein [Bacilli bacterium]